MLWVSLIQFIGSLHSGPFTINRNVLAKFVKTSPSIRNIPRSGSAQIQPFCSWKLGSLNVAGFIGILLG